MFLFIHLNVLYFNIFLYYFKLVDIYFKVKCLYLFTYLLVKLNVKQINNNKNRY